MSTLVGEEVPVRTLILEADRFTEGGDVLFANSRRAIADARDLGRAAAVKEISLEGKQYTVTGTTYSAGQVVAAEAWELVPEGMYAGPAAARESMQGRNVVWAGQRYRLANPVRLVPHPEEPKPAELPAVRPDEKPKRAAARKPKAAAALPGPVVTMPAAVEAELAAEWTATLRDALHPLGNASRIWWKTLRAKGMTDAELKGAIGQVFGMLRRCRPGPEHDGFCVKGLTRPRFWRGDALPGDRLPDLQGRALVQAVRELLEIPLPSGGSAPPLDVAAAPELTREEMLAGCEQMGRDLADIKGDVEKIAADTAEGGPLDQMLADTRADLAETREILGRVRAASNETTMPAGRDVVTVQEPGAPGPAVDTPPAEEASVLCSHCGQELDLDWDMDANVREGIDRFTCDTCRPQILAARPTCHRCQTPLREGLSRDRNANWNPVVAEAEGVPRETCSPCREKILRERLHTCQECGARMERKGLRCDRCQSQHMGLRSPSEVPLADVAPNRLNPRRHFPEEALEELAASIREHGIVEPLVVMANPGGPRPWVLIAGERRLRAAAIAGLESVPVIVRTVADEREALSLMLVENLQRQDLRPVEEARAYRALCDLGWTQSQVAAAVGRTQSGVANTLRLLELPEPVQDLLAEGKLRAAHGRTLARFAKWPDVCTAMAQLAAERATSSRELEQEALPFDEILNQRGVVLRLGAHRVEFDVYSHCRECPFGARLQVGDDDYSRNNAFYWFCLNPGHATELQAAAIAEKETQKREQAEQLARQLAAGREAAVLALHVPLEAGAKGGAVADQIEREGEEETERPEEAGAPLEVERILAELPDIRGLPYQSYERLSGGHLPSGCSEACECRALARGYNGEVVPICLKPRRYHNLRGRDEKALREKREAKIQTRWDAAAAAIGQTESGLLHALQPKPLSAIALAIAAFVDDSAVRAALAETALPGIRPEDLARWNHDRPALLEALAAAGVAPLADFALRLVMAQDRFRGVAWHQNKTPVLDWLAGTADTSADAPPAGILRCGECGFEGVPDPEDADGEESTWAKRDLCVECAEALHEAGALDEEGHELPAKPCRACEKRIGADRLCCEWCGAAQEETGGEIEERESEAAAPAAV